MCLVLYKTILATEKYIRTMGQLNWECCAVFLVSTFLCTMITVESYNENNQITNKQFNRLHQWYTTKNSGVWHEDGLNRRKRNILYEEAYRTPVLEPEPLDTVVETIQERPWGVLSFNEGKRQTVNFTPRLGRESEEESEQTAWLRDPEVNREMVNQRSPPFAPRLGRRMNTYYFDPRLGKRNNQQKHL